MAQNRLKLDRRIGWLQIAKPALLISAVVLSAVLALQIVNGLDPTYLFGALIGLIAAVIIYRLRRMEYGLLAVMLAAGLINFFTLPTGRDSRIVISLLLSLILLAIWILQLIYHGINGIRIQPSPINKPLLAFVAINVLSYVWSQLMRDPLLRTWNSFPVVQLAALVVNIALPGMTLLAANKFKEEKWLQAMLWIVIGLGALDVVTRFFNLPTIKLIDNGTKGVFPAWFAVCAYAMALFNTKLKPWQRIALLGCVAMAIWVYFFRTRLWLSGWLPMMVGLIVVTFFYSRRLFAYMCVVALVVVALNFTNLYETIFVANVDEGGLERFTIWGIALSHVVNHPLLGMGPAGYAVYYMTYNPLTARSTHNNYFDVLAQTGIIGFVSFVVLLVAFGVLAWKTRKAVEGRHDATEAYGAAAIGGFAAAVIAMMLGDWILPFAYNQTITGFDNAVFTWLMLGGMVALYHMAKVSGAGSRVTGDINPSVANQGPVVSGPPLTTNN